jgi:hypothetical protein
MAKPKKEAGEAISLFPFLSILTCVIGTLMLLITAIAMARMVGTSAAQGQEKADPAVARAVRINQLNNRLALERDHLNRLEMEIAERDAAAKSAATELERARAKAASKSQELSPEQRKVQAEQVALAKLAGDAQQAAGQAKQIQAEIERTRQAVEQLHEQLKKEGKLPEEREVKIQPSGSGTNLVASFVECAATGIVIHEGKEPARIRTADLKSSPEFGKLLERVHDKPDGIVIFLIRSDGLDSYQAAQAIAQQNYVRNGKLPVVGQGRIDLSLMGGAAN